MSEEQTKAKTNKKNKFVKPKRNRIIKRKPGTQTKNYMDEKTQASIESYQGQSDLILKNKVYTQEILPAFDSLVENLINVYGFKVSYENKKDLKSECLEFLYRTVNKFDTTKGSKAFSYFNVVAKNWLTIRSKQNVKRVKTYISSDDRESFSDSDIELYESFNLVPSYEDMLEAKSRGKLLSETMLKMKNIVKTDNEKLCLEAVDKIIVSLDDVEILSKRAILIYIKEITGMSSKQLSCCLSSLKKRYKEMKKEVEIE
jgi:hypothetical protein